MQQIREVEQFLYYLQDKVQEYYKFETNQAIQRFLEEMKGSVDNGKLNKFKRKFTRFYRRKTKRKLYKYSTYKRI